ncbi:hypothetical protein, partial [Chromatium okenii]|uniref:hypothetical protein n=1 Tax=Chromatium okenii TaxID=61644 RepID=UPI0026EFDFE2
MLDFVKIGLCAVQSRFHKNQQFNFQLRNSYSIFFSAKYTRIVIHNHHNKKTPASIKKRGFWIKTLAVTYIHMGRPHTSI